MNKEMICAREGETWTAIYSGAWSAELHDHVNCCSICDELCEIVGFLRQEALSADAEAILPGSELVWRRAQLSSQRAAIAQACRPIALFTNAGCLGGVVAMVWFLFDPKEWRRWMAELGAFQHGTTHVAIIRAIDAGTTSVSISICLFLCLGIAYVASFRSQGHLR